MFAIMQSYGVTVVYEVPGLETKLDGLFPLILPWTEALPKDRIILQIADVVTFFLEIVVCSWTSSL